MLKNAKKKVQNLVKGLQIGKTKKQKSAKKILLTLETF